jgi:transposase
LESLEVLVKTTAIGIDISKQQLDLYARPTGEAWRVAQQPEAFPALIARLKDLVPEHIVMEATGGLEILLATQLAAAGLPVVVINPRPARDFAKATGQLAKTDQVDARVLAHFGEVLQPVVRALPDEQTRALEATLTRRRQLVNMLVAEKNRHAALTHQPTLQKVVAEHITWLNQHITELYDELKQQLEQRPVFCRNDRLLQSVPASAP